MRVAREIEPFPEEPADAWARLDASLHLSMPLSRPMPDIGVGLKARSGAYRIVYALVAQGTVHALHAFKKTTQSTSARNLVLARKRLKEIQP